MADAVAQYRLMSDPTARIRAIPERGREELESDDPVNMLTVEEMQLFVRALKDRWPQWFTMLYVQFATASRFSEVSALRWEDIDKKGGVIRIRRGNWRTIVSSAKIDKQRRTIGLTAELTSLLDEWHEHLVRSKHRHLDSGWVFPSRVGKPPQLIMPDEGVHGLPLDHRGEAPLLFARPEAYGEQPNPALC